MLSRRPPRQRRRRRRLETEGEEVWGGEGARGRGREGRSGGGEVGPAGGRLQLPPASRGLQAAGRTQRLAIHRGAARGRPSPTPSPSPSPEPRASAAAASRQPVPGRAAAATATATATAGKAACAEQVASALLRPGKVSPAAADGSWRGIRPLPLEGRGSAPQCPPCAPPPRSRGLGDPSALPPSPRATVGHGGGGGGMRGSQDGPGEAQEPSSTSARLGKGRGRRARPHPNPLRARGFPRDRCSAARRSGRVIGGGGQQNGRGGRCGYKSGSWRGLRPEGGGARHAAL